MGLFRTTLPSHHARHSGLLRPTGTHASFWQYYTASQKVHDYDISHVAGAGTPNPREKYWWRRVMFRVAGNWRAFTKDNIYKEELPIVFNDPVAGGHGDRFTHSWGTVLAPANSKAYFAVKRWERENLTAEQLAAKYGFYVPRPQLGELVTSSAMWFGFWCMLILSFMKDPETVIMTHSCIDDHVRDFGGIELIHDDDIYLEQWQHPIYQYLNTRAYDPHFAYKPIVKENVVDKAFPVGAYFKGGVALFDKDRCQPTY